MSEWVKVTQSCPTLCNPMDCRPPGSSVRGILQTRILEWVAISFSWLSSQPRIETGFPVLQADSFVPLGKPHMYSFFGYVDILFYEEAIWLSPLSIFLNCLFWFVGFLIYSAFKIFVNYNIYYAFLSLHGLCFLFIARFWWNKVSNFNHVQRIYPFLFGYRFGGIFKNTLPISSWWHFSSCLL